MKRLNLSLTAQNYAVCQLPWQADTAAWANIPGFLTITRTADELSLVCLEEYAPAGAKTERGWRLFKVAGPLDFALVGILADLAGILAAARVSIFAISTFDTDYLLVKDHQLQAALAALQQAGHTVLSETEN